jgi:hypothetical protein
VFIGALLAIVSAGAAFMAAMMSLLAAALLLLATLLSREPEAPVTAGEEASEN